MLLLHPAIAGAYDLEESKHGLRFDFQGEEMGKIVRDQAHSSSERFLEMLGKIFHFAMQPKQPVQQ